MDERIAFAACFKLNSDPEQRVWQEIDAQQPHHLLLLGDQIYMDYQGDKRRGSGELVGYELGEPAGIPDAVFDQQMRLRYERQLQVPGFRKLVDATLQRGQVDLVWDDHDFGFNNAIGRTGGEMDDDPVYQKRLLSPAKKAIALQRFNDFRAQLLGPRAAPQAKDGVYKHLDLAHARVLLLDTRSWRQSPNRQGGAGRSEILGAEQWTWLERLTREACSDGKLVVLAAGSPLTSSGYGSDQSWLQGDRGKAPYAEYVKLLALAREMRAGGGRMLFIGGDRHAIDIVRSNEDLPEIVCAGSAAPKFLFPAGRHFGLLDVSDAAGASVSLFKKGKASARASFFDAEWAGLPLHAAPEPLPGDAADFDFSVAAAAPPEVAPNKQRPQAFMLCTRQRNNDAFSHRPDIPTCWITRTNPGSWDTATAWDLVDPARFVQQLQGQHTICFYVHGGIKNWWDTVAKLRRPVHEQLYPTRDVGQAVLVAWAASNTVDWLIDRPGEYEESIANAEAAGEALAHLMAALHHASQPRFVMLASSMGNRVVQTALHRLHVEHPQVQVDRWIALAPDLDTHLFETGEGQGLLAQCGRVEATYFAADPVLASVAKLTGRPRAGQSGFSGGDDRVRSHDVQAIVANADKPHSAMLDVERGTDWVQARLRD